MNSLLKRLPLAALALIALALAAAAAFGALSTPRSASAAGVGDCIVGSDWGTDRPDLASSVVSLVNSHRTSVGLGALKVSPSLTSAAVWKARHMAKYSYMQHDDPAPPVARTVSQRLAACGYPSSTAGWGENIAYGYGTPSSVVSAWLNSPGHRANIENASYRTTGVGAAASAGGVLYWSQDFGTYDDSGSGGGGGGSTGAPTVTLTSGPASSTTSTTASFAWTTGGTVSSTTCSVDGAAAVACTSPRSYSGLGVGTHTFRVTVANSAGSASANATWTVTSSPPPPPPPPPSGTAPTVQFTSAPYYVFGSGKFAWSTTGTVTSTTCAIDSGAANACTSPTTVSGLYRGTHRLTVTVSGPGGTAYSTVVFRYY